MPSAPPYGHRMETRRELVPIPEEQAVLWLVAHLRRRGWSLQQIADELNERIGVKTRQGLQFSRQTIHLLLRRTGEVADDLADTG